MALDFTRKTRPSKWHWHQFLCEGRNHLRHSKILLPFWDYHTGERPEQVSDLIYTNPSVLQGSDGPTMRLTPQGLGMSGNETFSASRVVQYSSPILPVGNSGDELSITITGVFNGGATQTLVCREDAWTLRIEGGTDIYFRTFGGAVSWTPANWDSARNEVHTLCLNWLSGTEAQLSWDGEDLGTNAITDTSSSGLNLDIGHRDGAENIGAGPSYLLLVEASDRRRSVSDANNITADPYQLVRPSRSILGVMYEGGGATTVTLSGVSATGSVGTLASTGGAVQPLTGASATGQIGTLQGLGGALSVLSGVSSSGSVGTLSITGGATITLNGASASGQVGTLTVQTEAGVSVVLSGTSATGQVGTLNTTTGASVNLSGVQGTGQVGTLTVVLAGGVTVTLSGVEATAQAGDLSALGSAIASLDGVEATGSVEALTVGIGATVTLSGVQATGQTGVFEVLTGATVTLTGVSSAGEVGAITIPGGTVNVETPTHRIYAIEHEDRTYIIFEEKRNYTIQ